ncbi:NgoFVII family restriction endonuclease [Bacillus sp. AFS015802]|uniref:DEAD/DEAH box helicase n=1 Tax=Bacillus sp. AFS015802 TaxID=2033486 RepID=UPI000BF85D8A|nr:DEAD/DEAH box helicase [Bacillus sp. AFS015802]PFA62930.1 NgoFVII family restriction endonuclease [Bacillus sp. AFS015802]
MLKQGIYEQIITQKLQQELSNTDLDIEIGRTPIDVEEARKMLSSYISSVTRNALKHVRDQEKDDHDALLKQIETCNEVIDTLSRNLDQQEFNSLKISEEAEVLTHIYSRVNSVRSIQQQEVVRPVTPISESSLFTGSSYEPNMLGELKKEILSSDSIEMLVSFIKWSGLRIILEELKTFTEGGGKLRIITTSYMEATDYKAIQELSKLSNTEIRISYDVKRTRLHAKAYLFKRDTGFSTAYIGSSNLSNPALTSGLEWNVKVTEKDSFDVLKKCEATFESYWNDKEFKAFNGENKEDTHTLRMALERSKFEVAESSVQYIFDIQPYYYQKEILEKLQAERDIHGRHKNLLVAATGVGKTVISAFDYKRFRKANGGKAKLLFVAHREEILKQSMDTFRAILRDPNFGEMLVGTHQPSLLDHLFVSIQSFNSKQLHTHIESDYYDFIIVDEFHHAAADSYQKLLDHFHPRILLGLTATPERMDGKSVLTYFEDHIAAEMRLTEAINQKLLSPFQYFCVTDTVDLSHLKWSRGGYDTKQLENVYTSNDLRSSQIIQSVEKYVTDLSDVKGLGFCVSISHAQYMADFFNQSGIPSIALHGGSDKSTRMEAQRLLVTGDIKFIFVVDLYNEGIDIPEINTVLFLRPTESLTVFLQQLGRGLRLAEDKECLTVLDFVGKAHQNYSYEEKLRALIGKSKHSVQHYVENGFFNLPKGCFVQLEKQAKEYILRNIKSSANTKANIISKLKTFEQDTDLPLSLFNVLTHYHLDLYDFYGGNKNRSYHRLLVEAGIQENFTYEKEKWTTSRLPNLFHLNSRKLLSFLLTYIDTREVNGKAEELMLNLFYYSFYQAPPAKEGLLSIKEGIDNILEHPVFQDEIKKILEVLYESLETIEMKPNFDFTCPLQVHSQYSTAQIMAGFNYYNEDQSPAFREGVKYFKDKNLDIFFITLNKSEKDFSPSTLYEDYAINETLFHWETQSRVSEESPTGQRYIHHRQNGGKIALFVREYKKEKGSIPSPFVFLGTANYIKHSGNKPMSFVWELEVEMPSYLVPRANKNIL